MFREIITEFQTFDGQPIVREEINSLPQPARPRQLGEIALDPYRLSRETLDAVSMSDRAEGVNTIVQPAETLPPSYRVKLQ